MGPKNLDLNLQNWWITCDLWDRSAVSVSPQLSQLYPLEMHHSRNTEAEACVLTLSIVKDKCPNLTGRILCDHNSTALGASPEEGQTWRAKLHHSTLELTTIFVIRVYDGSFGKTCYSLNL